MFAVQLRANPCDRARATRADSRHRRALADEARRQARELRARTGDTLRRSSEVRAAARRLRAPRCSTPDCKLAGPLAAYFGVRCTVGVKRRIVWLRLPVAICDQHRGVASLRTSMRRSAPALLTNLLRAKGFWWPGWHRARIIYLEDAGAMSRHAAQRRAPAAAAHLG